MANLQINFDVPKNADELFSQLKGAIEDAKGNLTGDRNSGDFEVPTPFGKVKGFYAINEATASVTVTEKPAFLADSLIESKLRDSIAKHAA